MTDSTSLDTDADIAGRRFAQRLCREFKLSRRDRLDCAVGGGVVGRIHNSLLLSQPAVALQSFSQSLCDEKGVAGLLQAPDLAVSQCPEMGESGLHPPPLLRNAEIASENDHVIARLEVLVPFRVELVEVGQKWEKTTDNRVDTAIDAPVGESFGNI